MASSAALSSSLSSSLSPWMSSPSYYMGTTPVIIVKRFHNGSSSFRFSISPSSSSLSTFSTTSWGGTTGPIRFLSTNTGPSNNDNNNDNNINNKNKNNDDNCEHKVTATTTTTTTATSQGLDPPMVTWIDDVLPSTLQPYARLARMDKPIGTWLLLWPCIWSTTLATSYGEFPNMTVLSLFGVGAFIMRGAGCTMNDIWDQDLDKHVARTSNRPLASGILTTKQAMGFLFLQGIAGLGVLLSLPHLEYCFLWGISSLPLVVVYPLMKRYFLYPQLFLGLTFNWGAWMGWAAIHGSMDYTLITPLYLSGVTWTLVYDTIYAHQDKVDDRKLGLYSTAITFGETEEQQKMVLHGLATLTYLQWLLVGWTASTTMVTGPDLQMIEGGLSFLPYMVGMTSAYGHLVWQIHTADLSNNSADNLGQRFRSNTQVGALVFASILAGKLL